MPSPPASSAGGFSRTSSAATCRSASSPDDPDLDFDPPSDAGFAADLEAWRAECAVSREIVAAHDLDDTARPLDWNEDVDLRWLVLRMITEYAQHCGHIDLLREGIDGTTGA
jgi:hypothetical protein